MWNSFIYFAITALLLWAAGAFFAWKRRSRLAIGLTVAGLLVFFAYILSMWITLERPPLRTMGETRLWYSLFLPLAGLFVYSRWRYNWILTFSTIMATVFICVNLFKPEIHSKALMPALQSPWFAPHVIVYMFAYAMLGASFLMAIYLLSVKRSGLRDFSSEPSELSDERSGLRDFSSEPSELSDKHLENYSLSTLNTQHSTKNALNTLDNLVYVGLAFMTFGMLFGALWAKEAWGHYWSWDPKETWAAATWLGYLVYIHYRRLPLAKGVGPAAGPRQNPRIALWMLIVCFVLLQMCWWGINYLPAAQGASVHTYGS